MPYHIAQINIGRLWAPIDDPQIHGFVSQLEKINALAERSPGFVWRLQSTLGNATDIAYNDDPAVMLNMSVWESVRALRDFTYRTSHAEVFRDRAKWFEKMEQPIYCLWWVPVGHIPTVANGRERLEHYQKHGPTVFSFSFSQHFPAPQEPCAAAG